MAYQYHSMKSPRSIRLLELEPFNETSTLRCSLVETLLDCAPKYDALSYTWGSQDLSKHISCDGKILHVTESCRDILRRLRSKSESLTLWIDAICINQESEAERTQQVQLMGEIYKTAQKVVIWLGKGTRKTNLAFEYLSQFATQASIRGRQEMFERYLAIKLEQIGFDGRLNLIDVIAHVLNRPWFQRMWTLQELALGTGVLVLCGKSSMTWHSLALGVQCVGEALRHDTSMTNIKNVLLGSILHHNLLRWAVSNEARIEGQRLSKPLSCLGVLVCAQTKKATNPKDKVFALYGVFQALKIAVPKPDYSKSESKIYTEITQAAILHDRSSNILECVVLCGNRPDAPSWVPNWNGMMMATIIAEPFHAAKNSSSHYQFSSDGSLLTLSGIRVDGITGRGDPVLYPGGHEAAMKNNLNVFETFKSIKEWYQYVRHLNPYRTGQSAEEAFFRMLILDGAQANDTARDPERFRESFQQWFQLVMICRTKSDDGTASYNENAISVSIGKTNARDITQLNPEEAIAQNNAAAFFQANVMHLLSGKALFVTQTGYMGTSPVATEVGDILVVFAGTRLPAVVRKKGTSYIYIGPAYAHGIMDGEAWERQSVSLEEFTII